MDLKSILRKDFGDLIDDHTPNKYDSMVEN